MSIADLAPGDYALHVDGVFVGPLTVTKTDGSAKLRLSSVPKKKEVLLTVPLDGALVEVFDGAQVVLHATLP